MKVEMLSVSEKTLCWVSVNPTEALALIQSLASQLEMRTPNGGRLESRCKGDAQEFSIAVIF
jgi:hypothetical protein